MGQGLFYYIEYMNNQLTENYLVKRPSWPSNSIFVWIQAYLNYMDFSSYFWLKFHIHKLPEGRDSVLLYLWDPVYIVL